jgi:hypothetical protein|tara:strand:+ start:34061 stop:34501 length:441 start_codon:yes stop_codon:yes gene_type:complete
MNNQEQDKERQRMKALIKSFNSKQEVFKTETENLNEEEIKADMDRIKKNLNAEDVNENFYSQGGTNTGMKSLKNTVSNVVTGEDKSIGSTLRPEEAVKISLMRTLESGAPVNNMGFYDEINWHLSRLGHASKNPIDIKSEVLSLIK